MTFFLTEKDYDCPVTGCNGECRNQNRFYGATVSKISIAEAENKKLGKILSDLSDAQSKAKFDRLDKFQEEQKAITMADNEAMTAARQALANSFTIFSRFREMLTERDALVKEIFAIHPTGMEVGLSGYQSALKQANEFILGKYGEEID